MLFLLFGSSGSGKTTLVDALRGCAPTLACHDFDEVGVPRRPTIAWRQRMLEQWVRRAIALQRDGVDLLLAGQSPLGELVAAPSACELDRYAACLLDCDDETRATRLRADPRAAQLALGDLLGWAAWMRAHARDPEHMTEVLRTGAWAEMRWDVAPTRPWRVEVVDTSSATADESATDVLRWVATERSNETRPLGP